MSLCASVLTPDATLVTAIKLCNTMKMGDRLNRTTFNYNVSHCMSVAQVTHHPVVAIAGPALWHFALRPSTTQRTECTDCHDESGLAGDVRLQALQLWDAALSFLFSSRNWQAGGPTAQLRYENTANGHCLTSMILVDICTTCNPTSSHLKAAS